MFCTSAQSIFIKSTLALGVKRNGTNEKFAFSKFFKVLAFSYGFLSKIDCQDVQKNQFRKRLILHIREKESEMFYRKLCGGMLLCCLLISGCGNGGSGQDTESQSVELFVTGHESSENEAEESGAEASGESGTVAKESADNTDISVEGTSGEGSTGNDESLGQSKETDEKNTEESAQEQTDYRSELFEFSVTIGQTVYTLPEDFQKFVKMEWNYDGNKELELNPHEYITDEAIYKGNHLVYVSFVNLGYDMATIQNSKVGSILFDQIALKDANTNIMLAGEIKYGVSSLADVLKAYGEPDSREESDSETVLTYGQDEYSKVVITVNKKKDVITDIYMMNYADSDQNLEISQETPDIVNSYEAPEKMGVNVQKPLLYVEGAYYRLPAPVKAFTDNGWKFEADEYDAVAAGKTSSMYLTKGNYRVSVQVTNYTSEVQYLKNCFVTRIQTSKSDQGSNIELTLPGKIKTGMTADEMLAALGNVSYEKEESDTVYDMYTVKYENNTGEVRLYVLRDVSLLWRIVVKNQPDKI